jgi:Glycosyl transferase family 2
MKCDQLTVVILTFNEAPNLRRALESVRWASRIVVVDSGSSDETVSIANAFPHTTVHVRPFDNHTAQWNFGLDQASTGWILSLDADYVVTRELADEIRALPDFPKAYAFYAAFKYCVHGQPLRASLLPPRAVLFDRRRCLYVPDGHTQTLRVMGKVGRLNGFILHDDRKSLSRWFWAQERYARLEVQKLLSTPAAELGWADRIRRWGVFAPLIMLFYVLIVKGVILDGRAGWFYAMQRTVAEMMLALFLWEAKFSSEHAQRNETAGDSRKDVTP